MLAGRNSPTVPSISRSVTGLRRRITWPAYWTMKAKLKPVIEGAGLNIPFPTTSERNRAQRVITFVNAPQTAPGA